MKIVHIGASGVIGRAVAAELGTRHEIVAVNRGSGDYQVDIADPSSIARLFNQTGHFDALICTAGAVHFAALQEFSVEQYSIGLKSKLMGQVNLVRSGRKYLRDGCSFTLTSGPTNEDPIPLGTSWLETPALRRRCQAGLNKSEQRHALSQAICTFRDSPSAISRRVCSWSSGVADLAGAMGALRLLRRFPLGFAPHRRQTASHSIWHQESRLPDCSLSCFTLGVV